MGYNSHNMTNRSVDWFKHSKRDVEQAVASQRNNYHEWACFAAHQAAEKALKALHLYFGQEAWERVVARMIIELSDRVSFPENLIEKDRVLDNYYIPSRYPNGHPGGAPFEYYDSIQSSQTIEYAGEILEFVRLQMA